MRFADFLSDLLDYGKRDANGNITLTGSLADPSVLLNVEEIALFSVIDLIASAGSLCEWRTYQDGKRVQRNDWYAWNVSPNQNQNAAEFKRMLIARLLRFREALVFERNGSYYIADSFCREEYAFRPNAYTGVTCCNLTMSYTMLESDVFYFRLGNSQASALLNNLNGLYSKALTEAYNKYQRSGSRSGILEYDAAASGSPRFEETLDKLQNDRFRKFFEQKNAVLPLPRGFKYVPHDGAASQKSTSEVSDMESIFRQAQDRYCNAYHVPPSILRGDVTNQDDAINAMLSFAVKPTMSIIQTEVNRKSYGKSVLDGWCMRIDTTHIKTVDVFAVAEKMEKLVQNRIYNSNGIREKLDDELIPEAWADEYIMTKNAEVVKQGGNQ